VADGGFSAMKALLMLALAVLALAANAAGGAQQDGSFRYVDPSQAALPFPYYSFVRQPWRSYLELTPASTYLNGLGVVWGATKVPGKTDEQVAADLAWAGFRRVRLEFSWNGLRWDENGTINDFGSRFATTLRALKASGLRPLILLNANHGAPCPLRDGEWQLATPAHSGDRQIQLRGALEGIVPQFSNVTTLASSGRAGPLVTALSAAGGVVMLSKPVAQDLQAGSTVRITRLKYQPLFPVGTPEFENTAQGWLKYVAYVIHFVSDVYGADFDLEMWNELSFGSDFLDINYYFQPPLNKSGPDTLRAGGSAWELGRRTAAEVRQLCARCQLIWGFSNTTFFHTPVSALPAGYSGQSYHPYGTFARCYTKLIAGREQYNADGFVPTGCATMPEGSAQTFQQTETLIRLLNPAARSEHPPGADHFEHYITEHGFTPAELGIHDSPAALRAKEKFLLRATLFWLNKGVSGLYVYDSYDQVDELHGMLQQNGAVSPAMQDLHRVVSHLAGADSGPRSPTAIDMSVQQLSGQQGYYPNDPEGKRVALRQLVTLLPYSLTPRRIVVAAYVMTEDFPRDPVPQKFRITLKVGDASRARVSYYDPLTDGSLPASISERAGDRLSVDVELTDSPRLLEIDT
jgi:hypothetical protein